MPTDYRPENVECPSCDGDGYLVAPCADGETRRSECFDCEGTGFNTATTHPLVCDTCGRTTYWCQCHERRTR